MFLNLFGGRESEVDRKSNLFRSTIRNYVLSFQSKRYPNCEDTIMENVNRIIRDAQDEIRDEWGANEDYQKMSLSTLYNLTFDMVTTGKYHMYWGVLNPVGSQLSHICSKCLYKSNELGYIDKETLDDQLSVLSQSIRNIG